MNYGVSHFLVAFTDPDSDENRYKITNPEWSYGSTKHIQMICDDIFASSNRYVDDPLSENEEENGEAEDT